MAVWQELGIAVVAYVLLMIAVVKWFGNGY